VPELIEKNKPVKTHHQENENVITIDNVAFKVFGFTSLYPTSLNCLVKENFKARCQSILGFLLAEKNHSIHSIYRYDNVKNNYIMI